MWVVNVLFKCPVHDRSGRSAWEHPVLPVLDDLAEKHQGRGDVSGSGHQSWAFPAREDAYAFAEEAMAASPEVVVITPELQD